jgi:HTH-type transcriptional regulator/antitoxin HigA
MLETRMDTACWSRTNGSMQMQFRRSLSEPANIGAISSWLRMGEQLAEKADTPHYDEARLRAKLAEIRALTLLPQQEFEPQLKQLLQEAGVTLVLVPAIPGAHVSGVARWLNPHRPLIQLSLYGKSNDRFWFTLFHELAHILLHSKEKNPCSSTIRAKPIPAQKKNSKPTPGHEIF